MASETTLTDAEINLNMGQTNPKMAAANARAAALKTLVENHQLEYDELHESQRKAYGLPANRGSSAVNQQLQALRSRITELESQLVERDS